MLLPLEISCHDAAELVAAGAAQLIDCRTPEEYATAALAGATLLPMHELPERLGELGGLQETRLIIHCHHGVRSLRVAVWLREQGFTQAQSMAGGIDAWSQEIDPQVPRY